MKKILKSLCILLTSLALVFSLLGCELTGNVNQTSDITESRSRTNTRGNSSQTSTDSNTTSSDTDSSITSSTHSSTSSSTNSSTTSSTHSSTTSTTTTSRTSSTTSTTYSADVVNYYSSINASLTGTTLRSALKKLMNDTHTYTTRYDDLRDWVCYYTDSVAAYNHYLDTGEALYSGKHTQPSNYQMYMFYTNSIYTYNGKMGDVINREHVIPQSVGGFGTSGAGADAHHLRPCDSPLNNTRGNYPFGECPNGKDVSEGGKASGCKLGNGVFEPTDEFKGDVARIVFYVLMHYDCPYNGQLDVLVKWNQEDPVSDYEMCRNVNAYAIQGNRNPFIDHPEWIDAIWG